MGNYKAAGQGSQKRKFFIEFCGRVLDVERSLQVTDVGASLIAECLLIEKLHIFHTSITSTGHATILSRLKFLRVLVRGDFLCEALEHMESTNRYPPA